MTRTCHFTKINPFNNHVKIVERAGCDVCAVCESYNPQQQPLERLNVTSLPIKHTKYCDILPHITAFVLSKQQEPLNSQQGMCFISADASTCTLSCWDRPKWTESRRGGRAIYQFIYSGYRGHKEQTQLPIAFRKTFSSLDTDLWVTN